MGHYDEALLQIDGYRKRLWYPDKKLLAHIWDDGGKAENRREFWGGGNGWAAAGLARVIRLLPDNRREDPQRLVAFVTELIDGWPRFPAARRFVSRCGGPSRNVP